jgi:hypothetical protein
MFSPLCEPQKGNFKRNITSLHGVHKILFLSHVGELLLSSIGGIQTMVKIESSVKQTWENLS